MNKYFVSRLSRRRLYEVKDQGLHDFKSSYEHKFETKLHVPMLNLHYEDRSTKNVQDIG